LKRSERSIGYQKKLGVTAFLAKNIGIRIYKDSMVEFLGAQLENLNYYMALIQAMWELNLTALIPIFLIGTMIGLV
jgi:hypothetical protein